MIYRTGPMVYVEKCLNAVADLWKGYGTHRLDQMYDWIKMQPGLWGPIINCETAVDKAIIQGTDQEEIHQYCRIWYKMWRNGITAAKEHLKEKPAINQPSLLNGLDNGLGSKAMAVGEQGTVSI